jgi:hypothetical protein
MRRFRSGSRAVRLFLCISFRPKCQVERIVWVHSGENLRFVEDTLSGEEEGTQPNTADDERSSAALAR